jgi:hypothetical protein
VKLKIPITFDEFGWSGLEHHARAERLELDRLLALACIYYVSELADERAATAAPSFDKPALGRETRTLVLELGADLLRRLKQEAERQGLALERLLEHAALLYLADLDAGRLAERIVRRA